MEKKDGHWPNFMNTTYLVATSSSPLGPFVVKNADANMLHGAPGDFSLFVDDDDAAYIAYNSFKIEHTISVERLSNDYIHALGLNATSGLVSPKKKEAPAMFKRNGWYYLLFGHLCCFCYNGSDASVYVSDHPLGPYKDIGNIDAYANGSSIIGAQQNNIFPVIDKNDKVSWIWTGDRWGSAPDHQKGHDFQYWQPLQFNDTNLPPTIHVMHWTNSFVLDL